MSYLFVINPNARQCKAEELKQILENKILKNKGYRSHKYDIIITSSVSELERKISAKTEKENISVVVAVGGDGTIATIIHSIMKHPQINLGIIPQGTGNILASNLGISSNLDLSLKTVFNGETKSIDLGLVNGKPFTIMTGVGLVANIIEDINKREKSRLGFWVYFIKGIKNLYSAKEYVFHVNADGKEIKAKSMSVFVSNAHNFLGFLPTITPSSDPADGYLNLFIVSLKNFKKEPLNYLKFLVSYLTNNLNQGGIFQTYKAKNITIKSNESLKIQADGCIISQTPAKIEILPGKLKILVPKKKH